MFGLPSETWWSDWDSPTYHFDGWPVEDPARGVTWGIGPAQTRSIREALTARGRMKEDINTLTEELDAFADLLGKLLKYRPEERISAKEAMEHEWFRMHDVYCSSEKNTWGK